LSNIHMTYPPLSLREVRLPLASGAPNRPSRHKTQARAVLCEGLSPTLTPIPLSLSIPVDRRPSALWSQVRPQKVRSPEEGREQTIGPAKTDFYGRKEAAKLLKCLAGELGKNQGASNLLMSLKLLFFFSY
jgi:hypothetical protein